MTDSKENPTEAAEHYDTHDVSDELEGGTWQRHESRNPAEAMSGFNARLPTTVLNDARRRGIPAAPRLMNWAQVEAD